MAIWAMRGCYYLEFAFHSSTLVNRVNEIGRHHLGYVPLFSPQNRRFDRQLDHNIQQEHIYSRVWFHDEWKHLRSSKYVEWSLECNVNLTTVWNKSIFITTKSIGCMGCAKWLWATIGIKIWNHCRGSYSMCSISRGHIWVLSKCSNQVQVLFKSCLFYEKFQ